MNRMILIFVLPLLLHCSEKASATAAAVSSAKAPDKKLPADACSLIPTARVASLIGELKDGPTPGTGLRSELECRFTNLSGSWTTIRVYGGGDDRWDWEKGLSETQGPQPLTGLGDEAFSIQRGTDAGVYARTGSTILEVSCSCERGTAESLARAAMEAL